MTKIQFIIAPKHEIQIERFSPRVGQVSCETVIGCVVYFLAHAHVLLAYLFSDQVYVGHWNETYSICYNIIY